VAKLTINGEEIDAAEGAPLVEVIKNRGEFISNLCYIDGLPPYAGCRTCIVEIEGARGFQLSCTTKVADGMVVKTQTPELYSTRQAVLSLIMSYHSDRCLTCHRVVKCKPGDTCLRDDTVTHRCLTCSKNYRCELQTTCEMLEMAGYEPWDGDERTYYQVEQPPADQANPFLEFDPQMCIICTRCVRACDELRHTGAITLAGRGPSTRIAFGADGPVHDSNCDFCGACIDVCPTATLIEHPNKWSATQTERWTATTCTQCSVGCTIHLGTKKGRGVIVRPDTNANPVSADQLCVRGRFGYDAVKTATRLGTPLIRRNGGQDAASWDEAMDFTVASLTRVREQHGPEAIGFLASPSATNEENYLLGKIARAIVGTNNIDSTSGPIAGAAASALSAAFGTEVLPADGLRIAQSKTLLVVAEDLESSHNVYAVRVKNAVVRNQAKLITVSAIYGEVNDFADVWIQPKPGDEPAVVAALASALDGGDANDGRSLLSPEAQTAFHQALELLKAAKSEAGQPFTAICALPTFGPTAVGALVSALANIAISVSGDDAAQSLLVAPGDANTLGMRDTGCTPELLPGYRDATDETARVEMQRLWGAQLPSAPGKTFTQMASDGIKAMVVLNDNPAMLAPDRETVRQTLGGLDFLAVINSLPTDTANLAHAVLPDSGAWAKDGTTVSADRRVPRLQEATTLKGEARQGWQILSELGRRLAERTNPGEIRINYASPAEIMDEMAQIIPLFRNATYREINSGAQQNMDGFGPTTATRVSVDPPAISRNGKFALTVSRGLFTSYEAAAVHSSEADRLHREDAVRMHPADAEAMGLSAGDTVTLRNDGGAVTAKVEITDIVQPKGLWLASMYDAGAPSALFGAEDSVAFVEVSRS
jgi:predicted molibdopterin-dependent oxidoreductase YjgC